MNDTSRNGNMSGDYPALLAGNHIVSWTGGVNRIVITPNWRSVQKKGAYCLDLRTRTYCHRLHRPWPGSPHSFLLHGDGKPQCQAGAATSLMQRPAITHHLTAHHHAARPRMQPPRGCSIAHNDEPARATIFGSYDGRARGLWCLRAQSCASFLIFLGISFIKSTSVTNTFFNRRVMFKEET